MLVYPNRSKLSFNRGTVASCSRLLDPIPRSLSRGMLTLTSTCKPCWCYVKDGLGWDVNGRLHVLMYTYKVFARLRYDIMQTLSLSLDSVRLRLDRYVWMWYWRYPLHPEGRDVLMCLGELMIKVNKDIGYWKWQLSLCAPTTKKNLPCLREVVHWCWFQMFFHMSRDIMRCFKMTHMILASMSIIRSILLQVLSSNVYIFPSWKKVYFAISPQRNSHLPNNLARLHWFCAFKSTSFITR